MIAAAYSWCIPIALRLAPFRAPAGHQHQPKQQHPPPPNQAAGALRPSALLPGGWGGASSCRGTVLTHRTGATPSSPRVREPYPPRPWLCTTHSCSPVRIISNAPHPCSCRRRDARCLEGEGEGGWQREEGKRMLGGVCAGEGHGGAQSGWCTAAPHGSNEAVKGSLHCTHSSSMIPTNTWFGQRSQWDGGVCVCVRVPRAHPNIATSPPTRSRIHTRPAMVEEGTPWRGN